MNDNEPDTFISIGEAAQRVLDRLDKQLHKGQVNGTDQKPQARILDRREGRKS